MKASEIELGKTYTIKHHDGRIYPVRVNSLDYALPSARYETFHPIAARSSRPAARLSSRA